MNRISSKATFYYKRVFPFVWFGFVLAFMAMSLFSGSPANPSPVLPFVIVPVLMGVAGYFLMKRLVFDLVDEVLDAGDALVVRNGGKEDRIRLSDIKNVNYSNFSSPPRVTLLLRAPSEFGSQIAFCAPFRLVPFSTSPVIDDLIERIDAARSKRRLG
jgi:hypothetical protein